MTGEERPDESEEDRQRRLALNEALARDVNELVDGIAAGWFESEELVDFRCECARSSCGERLPLTRAEYASVRESPTSFVLVAGHEDPELEVVVRPLRGHLVVSKIGAGVGIAEVTDPRAQD